MANSPYNTEEDLKWEQAQLALHVAYLESIQLNLKGTINKIEEVVLLLESIKKSNRES